MFLSALQLQFQRKVIPLSADWCENSQQAFWYSVASVARVNACSVTIAREIASRNKIPAGTLLQRPVLITTFGHGAVWQSASSGSNFLLSPERRCRALVGPSFVRAVRFSNPRRRELYENMNLYKAYFCSKGSALIRSKSKRKTKPKRERKLRLDTPEPTTLLVQLQSSPKKKSD